MQRVRILLLMTSLFAAGTGGLRAGQNQIQMLMQDMQSSIGSIDVEVAKLKALVVDVEPKAPAKQRLQSANNLKQLGLALHRQVQKAQKLVAETRPSEARSSIVNGYAAEFYAGSRLEFEKAVKAFPLKAGAGDAEAARRISLAQDKLRKAVEELVRQMQSLVPQKETGKAKS